MQRLGSQRSHAPGRRRALQDVGNVPGFKHWEDEGAGSAFNVRLCTIEAIHIQVTYVQLSMSRSVAIACPTAFHHGMSAE